MSDYKDFFKLILAILATSLIFLSLVMIAGCFNDSNVENIDNINDSDNSSNVSDISNVSDGNVSDDDNSDYNESGDFVNILRKSGKVKSNLPPPPKPN